jgi:hypothetical protein
MKTEAQARLHFLYQLALLTATKPPPSSLSSTTSNSTNDSNNRDSHCLSLDATLSPEKSLIWQYGLAALYMQQLKGISEKAVQRLYLNIIYKFYSYRPI